MPLCARPLYTERPICDTAYMTTHTKRFLATMLAASAIATWQASTALADANGPLEDEPGWSCVDQGNHICGPDNSNGVPPGCYVPLSEAERLGLAISDRDADDGGVLFAPWPCKAWSPEDGYHHQDDTTLASGVNAWDDGSYVGGFN